MLDLQNKSAINSDKLQVQHQATHHELKTALAWHGIILYVVGGE
jgi:hypothetical protein